MSLQAKHITLISLNFYPEDTAIGLYSTQLAQYLEKQGAEVSVITGFPYYPNWKIREDYKNKGSFYHEKIGNISIYRYKQFTPENPTFLKRIVQIVDFTIGTRINFKHIKNCDIVISVIPFTSSAWLGNTLSRKRNAKHWIHIQDFEFDAAFQSGVAKGSYLKKRLYRSLMKLERYILNQADGASTISYAMLSKLKQKTITAPHYVPNWVVNEHIDAQDLLANNLFTKSKFSILYAGNVGDKQDWDLFEKLVHALDPKKYEVVVVGAGGKFENLKKALSTTNTRFVDPVPFNALSSLLSSTDVHILFQKNTVIDTVMPSKLLGMMASGKPSIVTGHPEAETREIIERSQGGFYNSVQSVTAIVEYLERLRMEPTMHTEIGQNAQLYITQNFNKKEILANFYNRLLTL
ncbi:glycosyltransferase [Dokdonia sp. Hel_I_53]|uniref:glycosyltransferase n=1 Tax=Dokdonia sp. Hel_I_53 TaxID=1566287 RepID=UPI00119C5669|nr:glycosyltransferase [Dokdonia sp. Hel_I_53]TVZ52668.1 colanic acid biosynthesis glycosyl transferase WcaI [Dokdonia sp. Hel_I_53]